MRALAATVAIALALAACGGDGDDGPPKSDYLAEANAICRDNTGELDQIFDIALPEKGKPDPLALQSLIEELGPALRTVMVQLRQLERPEEDMEDVDRLYGLYDRYIAAAEAAGKTARGAVAFVQNFDTRFKSIDEAAREAGLPACGARG